MPPRQPYFTPQRSHQPTSSDIVPLELANLRLPDPSQFQSAPVPTATHLPPQLDASASAPSAPASAVPAPPALPSAPAQAQAPSSPSALAAPSPAAPASAPMRAAASCEGLSSEAPCAAPSAPRSGYAPRVTQVLNIIPDPRLPQPPITPRDKQPRNDRIALPAKLPRFRRRKTSRGSVPSAIIPSAKASRRNSSAGRIPTTPLSTTA
jgi:hypothetical protein